LSSKRELNAARDVKQQLLMQIDALVNELEVVKSELAGKISELNETKPQNDLARMQLRIFQETSAPSSSQVKTAKMHAEHAGEELAVQAECGAMNKVVVNQPAELVPADPGQLLTELNKEHSQADHISKLEAELESAQNAQAVMQDAWWLMQEPSYNMLNAESQNMALEVLARVSELAIAPSSDQGLSNGDIWVWEVFSSSGVNIRVAKSMKAAIIGSKDAGMFVCGRQEHGWVALTEEPGVWKNFNTEICSAAESGRAMLSGQWQLVFLAAASSQAFHNIFHNF